jgi:hypothetical protein
MWKTELDSSYLVRKVYLVSGVADRTMSEQTFSWATETPQLASNPCTLPK